MISAVTRAARSPCRVCPKQRPRLVWREHDPTPSVSSKLQSQQRVCVEGEHTKARRLNPKAQSFTAMIVTKDCCASVTCAGGETLKCCVTGPRSCESGTFSVACIHIDEFRSAGVYSLKVLLRIGDSPGHATPHKNERYSLRGTVILA
jgi:hypothetical protein